MSADIDKERAAFEVAYKTLYPALYFTPNGNGSYENPYVSAHWHGWQARAAIPPSTAEPAPERRAPGEAERLIGLAHIICDEAGIPEGEITHRLVALSERGDGAADSARQRARRVVAARWE